MEEKENLRLRIIKAVIFRKIQKNKEWQTNREPENQIQKIEEIPDDEYSVSGNPEYGRKNKENVIGLYNYEIGYNNAVQNELQKILDLLTTDSAGFANLLTDDFVTFGVKTPTFKNKELDYLKNLAKEFKKDKNDDIVLHQEHCELHQTNAPWALDERCTCSGAYIIRKRMKEGMTFKAAKAWVIENEML